MLPKEFEGLLDKERKVIDVKRADIGLVKAVIEGIALKNEKNPQGAGSV